MPEPRQYRHIRPEPRRGARGAVVLLLLAGVALVGALAYFLFLRDPGPTARDAVTDFTETWSRGDDAGAARATTAAPVAAKALRANRRGLDGAKLRASVLSVTEDGDRARSRLHLSWRVPQYGAFAYDTSAALRRDGEAGWQVVWDPKLVHPVLDSGTRLGTTVDRPDRGRILDRAGQPIVTPRAVVHVGVAHNKVSDPAATAAAMAKVVDVDPDTYARAIRRAGPQQFVEAVTLREADFEDKQTALQAVPGLQTVDDTAQLAPTRGFARALLGTVAPATAEQLERLGPAYGPGAQVGQFGLQAAFERRLAGTPARKVVVRLADGTKDRTLRTKGGTPGRSVRTTLDRRVQTAAETALGDRSRNAALVAVRPSTGDVLAVANRPSDSSFDRAIAGRYAPGSTFKVVSTAALLRDGLSASQSVPCPQTINVGGRTFKNFEGEAAGGGVPFAQDFAISCNTAFVSLSGRLPADALQRTARDFGLGRKVKLPVTAAPSQVPPGVDRVERAAAMIGQARIVASPLAMAGVAATVANGRWRAPRLVSSGPRTSGPAVSRGVLGTLRSLMRRVVTAGTGTAVAGVTGGVIGKTGTAEFGSGNPPPTHAWFIAARGDLAIAVLVERGRSGGSVAAPIAARFFSALGSSG
jgi:cell division protein FtsI/penicillin-binding protein 2